MKNWRKIKKWYKTQTKCSVLFLTVTVFWIWEKQKRISLSVMNVKTKYALNAISSITGTTLRNVNHKKNNCSLGLARKESFWIIVLNAQRCLRSMEAVRRCSARYVSINGVGFADCLRIIYSIEFKLGAFCFKIMKMRSHEVKKFSATFLAHTPFKLDIKIYLYQYQFFSLYCLQF